MTRRALREEVFKLLFRIEFNDVSEMKEQCGFFFEESDKEYSEKDSQFIQDRYNNIMASITEIDAAINEKAKGWTVDRMGKVDLTIIRLAAYEIMFDEEVPNGVAINEAVELAKRFGQDESYSFVNGILAKFV